MITIATAIEAIGFFPKTKRYTEIAVFAGDIDLASDRAETSCKISDGMLRLRRGGSEWPSEDLLEVAVSRSSELCGLPRMPIFAVLLGPGNGGMAYHTYPLRFDGGEWSYYDGGLVTWLKIQATKRGI
jgi:hypothetical protein